EPERGDALTCLALLRAELVATLGEVALERGHLLLRAPQTFLEVFSLGRRAPKLPHLASEPPLGCQQFAQAALDGALALRLHSQLFGRALGLFIVGLQGAQATLELCFFSRQLAEHLQFALER